MSRLTTPILVALWCVLLGYVWDQSRQQQTQLEALRQNQHILSQQIAHLNDRLSANTREQTTPTDEPAAPTTMAANSREVSVQLRANIRQALLLSQRQLLLGQWSEAQSNLQRLQVLLRSPSSQVLAPAIVYALERAIRQDLATIAQQAQQQQHAQNATDHALASLQQYLHQMATQSPHLAVSPPPPNTDLPFSARLNAKLSSILLLEPALPNVQQQYGMRAVSYYEVALLLGMARQALQQQQNDQVMAFLQQADQRMASHPDASSRQFRAWLLRLMQRPVPNMSNLRALSVLPELPSAS